jgi:hypothetical protein
VAPLNRPPREFKPAGDIHDERLTTKLRAAVRARAGVILLGEGRCWCWRCRVVGPVEEHRHDPVKEL